MGPLELSTRRQILHALVGAPWAVGACRRAPTYRFDGQIVEDNMIRAHAWRDGQDQGRDDVSTAAARTVEVAVLGAGAAGLTAAWRLRREGIDDVLVIDLADAPGGTAIGGRSAVTAYPWGAHYLPAPTSDNPRLVELLVEMGVVVQQTDDTIVYDEAVLCAAPQERVFYKGRWYPGLLPETLAVQEDRSQLARFRNTVADWVAFRGRDGRRAFTIPVAMCSDDPRVRRLDAMSMTEWLAEQRFDSPLVRAAVDYACRDDFGARPEFVSAWYGLHYFAARTPRPGAASAPFLTWPEGNARLVAHMADRVGPARLRTGTLVRGVRRRDGQWWVDTVGAAGRAELLRCQQVVFALPSFLRPRLLSADVAGDYRPTYGPWMVANVHLSGRPAYAGYESAWDNVIHGSRSLGYVVATHQSGSSYGPTVWTWYLPLAGADAKAERRALQQLGWPDAADVVIEELGSAHLDLARHVHRVDVRKWGHAMVRPEPGLAFGAARAAAARSVDGLHFAHSDLSGVALFEEAFYQGDRAAQAVLRYRNSTG